MVLFFAEVILKAQSYFELMPIKQAPAVCNDITAAVFPGRIEVMYSLHASQAAR